MNMHPILLPISEIQYHLFQTHAKIEGRKSISMANITNVTDCRRRNVVSHVRQLVLRLPSATLRLFCSSPQQVSRAGVPTMHGPPGGDSDSDSGSPAQWGRCLSTVFSSIDMATCAGPGRLADVTDQRHAAGRVVTGHCQRPGRWKGSKRS